MKKLNYIIGISLIAMAVFTSCEDKETKEVRIQPKGEFTAIDIAINVPQDANLDLSNAKLISFSEEFNIYGKGETQAIHNDNGRSLAMVIDAEKNPVLMGFITDDQKEISIKTTLEAAIFYSLGTVFLPEEVRLKFFDEVSMLSGMEEWINEASDMFKTNVNFMSSPEFEDLIKNINHQITNSRDSLDIRRKSIKVDGGDVRSGMQLRETSAFSFSLVNNYRRRAHSFIYKKIITPKRGQVVTLYKDILEDKPGVYKQVPIKSPQAIREVLGVVADYGAGTGINFAATETNPIELEIKEGEKEVLYKCRVIGPAWGLVASNNLTDLESAKYKELMYETFAYEIILPLLLDVAGHADVLSGLNEDKFSKFAQQIQVIGSSLPAMDEAMKAGDLKGALSEFGKAYYNNVLGANATDLVKGILEGVVASGIQKNPDYFIQNSAKAADISDAVGKYLQRADILLKFVDYSRITSAIASSEPLESWDVIVYKGDVILQPEESTTFPFTPHLLEVIIKDTELLSGQSFEFKWSTTGKFGTLSDDRGHQGISFSNSSKEPRRAVTYLCEMDDKDIPDNAEDQVFVEAILKEPGKADISLGMDTALVKVKSYKYEIKPNGVTIQGGHDLQLYLERPDGSENITNNQFLDFKLVWHTQGKHGQLQGSSNYVTVYNTNKMLYSCTDYKVRDGIETVEVSIYVKEKEEGDDGYELYDELEGSIRIDNDPKKIQYVMSHVIDILDLGREGDGNRHLIKTSYFIPKRDDAISYHLDIQEFIWKGNHQPTTERESYSWNRSQQNATARENDTNPNRLEFYPWHASINTTFSGPNGYSVVLANYGGIKSHAQVTIILE